MAALDRACQRQQYGFVRANDARAAKRQFQVSAALVLVLAAAAAVLSMFAPSGRPPSAGRPTSRPGSADDLLPSLARDGAAAEFPAGSFKDEP